jgi:MFS family permease
VVILLFPCAHLASRWGEKPVFLLGLGLFTLGSMLCALAWDLPSLIAFRVLQGTGAAALAALMNSMVTGLAPASRLGFMLGLVTAFATVGTSLGPTLGGFLIGWLGWRAIFFVNLPFGLLAFFLVWKCVPTARPSRRNSLSLAPLLQKPTVLAGLFGKFGSLFLNGAFLFLAPFLLEKTLDLTVQMAGLFLAISPLIIGVGAPYFGFLTDRIGPRLLLLLGPLIMLTGAISLGFLPEPLTPWSYAWRVALLALGLAIFNAPNNALIMGAVTSGERPSASALLSFFLLLGQAGGVWAAATLFHFISIWRFEESSLTLMSGAQIATSSGFSFWILALMPLALLIWNFFLPRECFAIVKKAPSADSV